MRRSSCYGEGMSRRSEGRCVSLAAAIGTAALVASLASACGGKSVVVPDSGGGSAGSGGAAGSGGSGGMGGAGGSGGTGGTGGTAGAGGSPHDAGLPNPDSSACVMQPADGAEAPCVLCSDDNWHCGALVYPTCPSGAEAGAPCAITSPPMQCVQCDGPMGNELSCMMFPKGTFWERIPIACAK